MPSDNGFNSYENRYAQGGRPYSGQAHEDGETLYASPVDSNPGAKDPRTGAGSPEDFQRLCQDIGKGVADMTAQIANGLVGAGGAIGSAVSQAYDGYKASQAQARERAELARQQAIVDARFANPGPLQTSGVIRTSIGGFFAFTFGAGMIETLFDLLGYLTFGEWLTGMVVMGVLFAGSCMLLAGGIKRLRAAKSLKSLKRIMGNRQVISISEISQMMGQDDARTLKRIKHLLKEGKIPEGRLDIDEKTLMVTNLAYSQYLTFLDSERKRSLEEQRAKQAANAAQAGKAPADPKLKAFLEDGNGYLKQMKQLDIDIDDASVSAKIVRIEEVVGRIMARAEDEPKVLSQLERMMDYYLPTTVKLLSAYDALEEQAVQGENIESSRLEIESTLDMLLQAYEKLLDSTFADLSMDVSSEISVLNMMLAQEGQTEDPFAKGKGRKSPAHGRTPGKDE